MKKQLLTLTTLAIIGLNNIVNAQAPNWMWAKRAGGSNVDMNCSVATDANGNVIMAGYFASSTITFGTTTLNNGGAYDIFIVKFDAVGNVLWAKSAGGYANDYALSVATDANDNVFITGGFISPYITFGTITLVNSGADDFFIAKYDASGNVLWAKVDLGADADVGNTVATDAIGNVFISGSFKSPSITFGTFTLTNAGGVDIFTVKYDASGNVLWAKGVGGVYFDGTNSAATDANGNVFITGSFQSPTVTFGSTTLSNLGYKDIFIAKYDANGNELWAKSAGGSDDDLGYNVATDVNGNVFIAGLFKSTNITFGNDTLISVSAPNYDVFFVKYDGSGNVQWSKNAVTNSNNWGYSAISIASDASGNALITGFFSANTITFGTTTLINAGGYDLFTVKYDVVGNVLWAKSAGSNGDDISCSIATDATGSVYIAGTFFSSTLTFGTTTLTNAGNNDIFIAKLNNTTGIEIAQNTIGFSIYPNPAVNAIAISNGQSSIGKTVSISITDVTGKLLYTNTSTASEKMEVNTKDFAAGVYLVQVQTADFISTQKVIIYK